MEGTTTAYIQGREQVISTAYRWYLQHVIQGREQVISTASIQ